MTYHRRLSDESRRAQWTEHDDMGVILWALILAAVGVVALLWWVLG